jgi:hypothetical protein
MKHVVACVTGGVNEAHAHLCTDRGRKDGRHGIAPDLRVRQHVGEVVSRVGMRGSFRVFVKRGVGSKPIRFQNGSVR